MTTGIHLFDKSTHHLFTGIEISNHTVAERTDGTYVFVGLSCVKENNPMYIYDLTIYNLRLILLLITILRFMIYKKQTSIVNRKSSNRKSF